MKKNNKILLLIAFVSFATMQTLFAQGTPPAPAAPPPGFPIPGIILATALAIGYGTYKTTQNTNSKK